MKSPFGSSTSSTIKIVASRSQGPKTLIIFIDGFIQFPYRNHL
nr:MAG TPA: hypothetical protein [Caudoviricetes sp.]